MKRRIIFVEESFSLKSGGRITSVFRRAKMFSEMGFEVGITAFNFRANYPRIFKELCKKHNVKNVELLSLYDYFAEQSIFEMPKNNRTVNDLDISNIEKKEEKRYEGSVGERQYDINVRANGTICKVDVFENDCRVYTDTCGASGHTLRRTLHIKKNGIDKIEKYYALDGHEYLCIEYYEDENDTPKIDRCSRCIWNKRNGEKVVLKSPYELISRWVKYIDDKWDGPLFFSEYRNYDPLILNQLDSLNGKIVATVHSTIFDKPYTFGSPIAAYAKGLIERINEYDAVITLTPQLKEDLERICGEKNNVYVIPHPLEFKDENTLVEKEKNTITICSRLTHIKRIDVAIDAIALVRKDIPDIRLNIFGVGEEYDELKSQIKRLHLENNVFLKGFTNEPVKEIAKAELTLILSEYEGLSLSLVEALAAGTPAITFDFNYGPRAVIKNGYNGYIVKNRDIDALANRIRKTLKRRLKLRLMSNNSKKIKNIFSQDNISKKWAKVFEEM